MTTSGRRNASPAALGGTAGLAALYSLWRGQAKAGFSLHPPYEIAFPDFDAGLAQDCVGGGAVEIEVRQDEMREVLLAGELQGVAGDIEHDLARLAAVDLLGLEALDVGQGGGDAGAQLVQRLFGVFPGLEKPHARQPPRPFPAQPAA